VALELPALCWEWAGAGRNEKHKTKTNVKTILGFMVLHLAWVD
jgi:hypothetical protein